MSYRGKKNPQWVMRAKFVGVRGKKWMPNNLLQPTTINDLQLFQPNYYHNIDLLTSYNKADSPTMSLY